MEDLLADVRRSLKLIGELDLKYEDVREELDGVLGEGEHVAEENLGKVASQLEQMVLVRLNTVEEANYAYDLVDYFYNKVAVRINKLKEYEMVRMPRKARRKTQEPTYCFCGEVSHGQMIGCDNENCPNEWYHMECLNLKSAPKGKWFCPVCRS
ncbi:hypothetical protein TRVA0_057S00276 [Trichomonascus vanleenenianus]|uniref:Yng1p n=1 Tax=Trichomonascus vanleenenianus TaxID=2268995 RepID=UPI003ECB48D4